MTCIEAIIKRQKASGIAEGSWLDPAGSYTLEQLLYAVEACLLNNWVNGTYTGGASLPTLFTADDLSGIKSVEALQTFVQGQMLTRKISVSGTTAPNYYHGFAESVETWAGATAAAEAAWHSGANSTRLWVQANGLEGNTTPPLSFNASLQHETVRLSSSGLLSTAFSKDIRYFGLFQVSNPSATFSTFSLFHEAVEDEYSLLYESAAIAGATDETEDLTDSSVEPSWCDEPVPGGGSYKGFQVDTGSYFALVDWIFGDDSPDEEDYDDEVIEKGSTVISRRVDGDHTFRCLDPDALTFVETTPTFPESPDNGDTYDGEDDFEWMYNEPEDFWIASKKYTEYLAGEGTFKKVVTLDEDATSYVFEFPLRFPTSSNICIMALPIGWTSSVTVDKVTSRFCRITLGTAAPYGGQLMIFWGKEEY